MCVCVCVCARARVLAENHLWLKVLYLSSGCSEIFATFKGGFRAQTMPLTRSKQLVGAQKCPRVVIQASTKSWFPVLCVCAQAGAMCMRICASMCVCTCECA